MRLPKLQIQLAHTVFSLIFSFVIHTIPCLSLAGQLEALVYEKGTRKVLADVNVYVLPQKIKATTDKTGYFKIDNLDEGEIQIVINQSGYIKFEQSKIISNKEPLPILKLYVEKNSYSGFETTIIAEKRKRDDSKKSLTQEQFLSLPGAGGDPVKAVQNLPGVNRVAGYSSQIVIQGSAPKDTSYLADGHRIPIAFHLGGFSSVIMPEALESVDYLSAGYGSEHSRALGGIISLQTRKPKLDEFDYKGFFFIDSLKTGFLYEAKIDEKSSYLISGRYSYIGLLLGAIVEKQQDFNLTVVPEFSDITAIYHRQINSQDELKVVTIASRDYLGFLLKQPYKSEPSLRGNFNNETIFYRLIPQWTRKISDDENYKLSVGIGENRLFVDVGQLYFRLRSQSLSTRGEWENKWHKNWTTQIGFDNSYDSARVTLRLPLPQDQGGVTNPISSSELRENDITGKLNNVGIYFRNEVVSEKLTSIPSLRLDSFSATKEKLLSPRLGFRYELSESLSLKTAGGIYYQPPEPQEIDPAFGNPDIKSPKAYHFTLGFEKDFRDNRKDGYSLNAAFFDRWFEKLVIQSSNYVLRDSVLTSENYNNNGAGRAYGIETQLKFDENPYTGWISYTWSKSVRWSPSQSVYNFEYDQTHNFNIVVSRELPRNWKASGRFRYVTGNPYTPITSSNFDSDNDVYIPVRGAIYSERQGDFSQLDLRFDKKLIFDRRIWYIYFDIQNALNQKNTETYQYSYNYKSKEPITGLPILPSFGVKGEF